MAHEFPDTPPITASPYQVICYIIFCYFSGLAPSTIRSHISVIGLAQGCHGVPDLTSHSLIKKALAGISGLRKKSSSQHSRPILKPITCALLEGLLSALDDLYEDRYTATLLRAMFILAFRAGLRCGELLYAAKGKHTLTDSDIKVSLAGKGVIPYVSLTFHSFKHSKQKVPLVLHLPATNTTLCPVRAINEYIKIRPTGAGPFFVFGGGKPVNRPFFVRSLSETCESVGYEKASYNTHSFRIGFVTYLRERGVASETIKLLGRWRSSAHEGYNRPAHITIPT